VGGPEAPEIHKLRVFYNHPGFIEPMIENVGKALDRFPQEDRAMVPLVFTAHSVPTSMAESSHYVEQLEEACHLVAAGVGRESGTLVYQSRSGPPSQPWLGPDICDHLRDIHKTGTRQVVVMPIGFVSDHMEVLYDLDTEARQVCEEIGLRMERASAVGNHPKFVSMIRELVLERLDEKRERRYLGELGLRPDVCAEDCCPRPQRPGVRKPGP
jgi:ferrochelatase